MSTMRIYFDIYFLCLMYLSIYEVYGTIPNYKQSPLVRRYDRQLENTLYDQKTDLVVANFNTTYNDITNEDREVIFKYTYEEIINKTTAVRVTVSLPNKEVDINNPVLFVVRQQQGILSWRLPMYLEYIYTYNLVSRNLCPVDAIHRNSSTKDQTVFVDVSTFSKQNITFTISADFVKDFHLRTDEIRNVNVTPSQPQYFMFTFPDNVDSVIVQAKSDSDLCMIFSLQDVKCPVFDLDRDVEFSGVHQTMTRQAAITAEKSSYDQNSFYIVTVLKPSDYDCNGIETIQAAGYTRRKQLTLQVYGTISAKKYYVAIIGAVSVFVGFYLVAFLVGVLYHGCRKNWGVWEFVLEEDTEETNPLTGESRPSRHGYGTVEPDLDSEDSSAQRNKEMYRVTPSRPPSLARTPSEDDVDFLDDATSEKNVLRTKTALFVCDLARKPKKRQEKNYKLFCRNLVAISIFYGLPVLQLVMTYQKVLHVTGDQDICYYNFDCSRPLGVLSAFNNVFSNIGYVMLGLLFLLLVWRRDLVYRKAVERNPEVETKYGLPQHNGLLYAMGLALCMEGVMSGCYHVCPNYSNFQFDTSFMYIIACLCMLRVYQSRHPDISAKAHTSYLVMAFVIFIAVVGVVYGTNIFWILFALVDMLASLILSVYIYYMGRFKMNTGIVTKMYLSLRYECGHCTTPMYKDRLVILFIGNVLNWSFAIYGAVTRPSDFASYLLGIFIGNLLLYSLFYIIMKLRYKEKIHPLAVMCILTATVFWCMALYFFFAHLTSWQLTPSQSRKGNKSCMLLDFYDAHDVWHFLSAIAMFMSFLVLLTLDDDLFSTRRDRITVF
ncbi:SID1 transmembrane family member 1-like [Mizuhopecten yessoensis]|uniref:SID1 transmembrane family member 1 n=1 Tax=Mizuhopecten yessoensis TaxID=6573 RepID=A0A210QFY5_MIZYE|nr:SID1 transmembrane family member 1-like [Mizuhopecten yessoensis]OWF47673.1 SID1 transmembrane family member 1 [Mizuhopecten yessoensis]